MDTKQRILDAAERLFAEQGFDGASLRSITAAAGVNLAAVNYHFRSKDALVQAVLARKLGPINRRRMELLDAYEAEAGPKPVPLEKLVYAMVAPMLQADSAPDGSGMSFGTVMGRVYLERDATLQRLLVAELQGVIRRFSAVIKRTLPALPAEEAFWRMFFTMGIVSHTMAARGMLELISGGACAPSDNDSILARLMAYVIPGLSAPVPAFSRKSPAGKKGASQPHHKRNPGGPAPLR